jgi:hypothetical protein
MKSVKGTVCHWTGTPDTTRPAEDYPSLAIVRDGRAGLPGPLCNLGFGRTATVYVVGAGLAYHAGEGYWPGVGADGNGNFLGIEAEEGGDGDWTDAMLDGYPRLCAALGVHYGYPVGMNIGHNEWAGPRKRDIALWPGGMPAFRASVQTRLSNPNVQEDDDMSVIFAKGDDPVWGKAVFKVEYSDASPVIAVRTWVPSPTEPGYALWRAAGRPTVTLTQTTLDDIPFKEGTTKS